MPRVKGAKGKKTLAKEAGMTLDEYLLWEKAGKPSNDIQNKYDKEKKKDEPLVGQTEIKLDKSELIDTSNSESDLKKDEQSDKLPDLESIKKESEKSINKNSKKKFKEDIKCERCHKIINGIVPLRINLTYLTTFPGYHRELANDRPLLCETCLKKMNKLVEEFLWNEGKGVELKFGQKSLNDFRGKQDEIN